MTDGKRFYWLKLHDDFFDSKRIKKLRRMAGGDTYTIIYLKMQLLAMKTEGILKWTGLESDAAEELALDLDEDADNVKMTLTYLLHCGLAETSDNVSFFFPYAVSNTGSEGEDALRKRVQRARQKIEKTDNVPLLADNVRTLSGQCHTEKDNKVREKRKIQESESRSSGDFAAAPTTSDKEKMQSVGDGTFGRGVVHLTEEQKEKLTETLGEEMFAVYVGRLADFILEKGARVRSHYQTILKWWAEDSASGRPKSVRKTRERQGTFDPEEAFRHALERTYGGKGE